MRIGFLFLLLLSTSAQAGNYAECITEKMPGVQSTQAAISIKRLCWSQYPAGLNGVEFGSGRRWFALYKTPDECFAYKAKRTTSALALSELRNACVVLYGEEK